MSNQAHKKTRIVTALWLLTIAFCFSVAFDLLPLLRGDMGLTTTYDWVWDYGPPRWAWLLPCALGVAAYVLGALHALETEAQSGYPVRLILWAFVGAVLLPLLLLTLEGQPLFLLFTRSASYLTGGYQESITLINDMGTTLRHWPQFISDYRTNVHPVGGLPLSPPGLPALYYGAAHILDAVPQVTQPLSALVRPLECQNATMMAWTDPQMASAWLQILMPLWAALAVAPLYKLGSFLFDRRVALWAVALWPLVPTLAMFTPRFNAFYPLIALVMLVVLWRGLERPSLLWIFVAGFVVSVGTFMNLTLAPLGLLAGLTIIGHAVMKRHSILRLAINMTLFGLGSVSAWVIYWALSGVSPLAIIQLSLSFNMQIQRPYLPWLFMHPYDMFLFIGWPIAGLAIWRMLRVRHLSSRADVFAVVSGLTLLIMVLSGTARGETGRVWSFFAPLWVLLAADLWYQVRQRERAVLFVTQAIYLLVIAAFLHVNFTTLTVPVAAASAEHSPGFPVNAHFVHNSDAITLVGFDFDQSPAASPKTLTLHLHWRADSFISRPYYLSVVTVPPDRAFRPGETWAPLDNQYPPTCWQPGQEFVDDKVIQLGDPLQPGGWLFSLAITDLDTRQPMDVLGDSTAQVGIGPINVTSK
jgi:hypothetical protein